MLFMPRPDEKQSHLDLLNQKYITLQTGRHILDTMCDLGNFTLFVKVQTEQFPSKSPLTSRTGCPYRK